MNQDNLAGATDADWIGRAPHEDLRHRSQPVLPSDDRFYQPPAGFEHAAPGTVLRSRDVELAFLGVVPQQVTATQLLYRTADMNGLPDATVTTVITPAEVAPDRPRRLVSYQCAIDAMASRCFPSYALRRRASAIGSLTQLEYFLIAAAVAEGWIVSIPDHEGPDGMWGAPYEPGYCVLDGVRATMNYEPFDLPASTPVGLWGYSGGGLASAWAAEMAPDYAPELDIVGAVLGSPVGDPGATFRRLNGTLLSGLPALVVAALAKTYPDLDRLIKEHATPEGRAMLDSLPDLTTFSAVIRMARRDMDSFVDIPLQDILDMPEVRYVLDNIKLGTGIPTVPVLLIQAVHDEVIAVENIDKLADAYSSGGADVTYHRDLFNDHFLLHPMSAPMALQWLNDRFAGRPLTDHLVKTTWPAALHPATYRGMWRLGVIAARVVTGRTLDRRPL